jgi:HPt (histidine-containing phosphotransfer) domain-containing protein
MIEEIEKCVKNLKNFLAADDMKNFCIEVHSIKSSLANIGVMELSAKARELEMASDQEDVDFCISNFQDFEERLKHLSFKLKEAFAEMKQNRGPVEIPIELLLIFDNLKNAFDKMDFVSIDNEISSMDTLNISDALKEKTEQIKDAVLIMDYEKAMIIMNKLRNDTIKTIFS